MDNTVNHMRYEIKVENRVKDKNNFFIKRNIAFLFSKKKNYSWRHTFFKISKNLIASAFFTFIYLFFLPRKILKNIDMPWQKPRMLHW